MIIADLLLPLTFRDGEVLDYAFFRITGLITSPRMLDEHGLGYYLSLPVETILKVF